MKNRSCEDRSNAAKEARGTEHSLHAQNVCKPLAFYYVDDYALHRSRFTPPLYYTAVNFRYAKATRR